MAYGRCMAKGLLHTVVEMPEFRRAAREAGLTSAELARIIDRLAGQPDAGDLIPGTGGARKGESVVAVTARAAGSG